MTEPRGDRELRRAWIAPTTGDTVVGASGSTSDDELLSSPSDAAQPLLVVADGGDGLPSALLLLLLLPFGAGDAPRVGERGDAGAPPRSSAK